MHGKRMIGSALLGLLGALALAVPANATVKVNCLVDGTAKAQDKTLPGGVQLVGGGGSYTFNSVQFTCAGTAKGVPHTESFQVTSTGKFSNIACGTGTAISGVGQTSGTGGGKVASVLPRLAYKVQFVLGRGPIHVNNDNVAPKNVPKVDLNLDSADKPAPSGPTMYEAGQINLAFDSGKVPVISPAPACTKAFHVTGFVIIHKT